ncbi:hypothetical protein R1sor_000440 [Riccia sorocarpa]|uniref:Uncharacterized protein n=1 Tax=Riccia sorocarpa TaxID=122646 RepID=A0ABD3GTX9_9MARC
MDCTDLNALDHDASGNSLLPDFGPPGRYLKRLQSEIRNGNWFHSVQLSREADGRDIEVAVGFQKNFAAALIAALQDRFQDNNIVSCFKIFNPRKVLETGKPMEALVLKSITMASSHLKVAIFTTLSSGFSPSRITAHQAR